MEHPDAGTRPFSHEVSRIREAPFPIWKIPSLLSVKSDRKKHQLSMSLLSGDGGKHTAKRRIQEDAVL